MGASLIRIFWLGISGIVAKGNKASTATNSVNKFYKIEFAVSREHPIRRGSQPYPTEYEKRHTVWYAFFRGWG